MTAAARAWKPRELFWIVKHGIKMSGMPSWADHGDDQLWNSVAFLQKLPNLRAEDYDSLLAAAKAKGIGHQMGDMPMNTGDQGMQKKSGDQGTKKTPNAGAEGMGHQH